MICPWVGYRVVAPWESSCTVQHDSIHVHERIVQPWDRYIWTFSRHKWNNWIIAMCACLYRVLCMFVNACSYYYVCIVCKIKYMLHGMPLHCPVYVCHSPTLVLFCLLLIHVLHMSLYLLHCWRTLYKQGPYGGKPVIKKALVVTPGSLVQVLLYWSVVTTNAVEYCVWMYI